MASRQDGVILGFSALNSNVRAVADALAEAGLLSDFHTTLDTTALSSIFARTRFGNQLSRRALSLAVHKKTTAHPVEETLRLLGQRLNLQGSVRGASVDRSLRAVDRAMARAIRSGTTAVYGYEDASLDSFRRAKAMGIPRVYDLPIAYWRHGVTLLEEEAERRPDWSGTLPHREFANRREREERKDAELALASRIMVASTFTANSLAAYGDVLGPVTVLPYGAPPPVETIRPFSGGPLRVLFVGGLSQRKGISYFFDAVEMADFPIEVTVVGRKVGSSAALDRALSGVKWIPSAHHARILSLMRESDVLVFPSLFEGFGLVLTEALSQGLPIITTSHTAGPDLIQDGVEGWIVPIRSSHAICSRLADMSANPDGVNQMKEAARTRAKDLSWAAYQAGTVKALREEIAKARR